MAKALLILFGGRIIPNVLSILYLNPQVVVPIVSEDELKKLKGFKKGVDDLLQEEGHRCDWLNSILGEPFVIKAHNKEDIKKLCEKVVQDNKDEDDKDYEWTFNVTSGTSVMSIAAYEAAQELKAQGKLISCWYLNTARRRVEVLVEAPGYKPKDEDLFRISLKQYASVHNKELKINPQVHTLPSEDKRLEFTNFLIQNNTYIEPLINLLIQPKDKTSVQNQISAQKKINKETNSPEPEYYMCERLLNGDELAVLRGAEKCGLICNLDKTTSGWSFKISTQQNEFLKGGWLEFYVYSEIASIKENNGQPLFQDVGINRHVHNKRGQGYNSQEENELDVSMIYNAQLFIIECKAGKAVKYPETIFKLDSVANAFGGGFVGKYLITALKKDEVIKDRRKEGNNSEPEKNNIEERLEIRKIRLITWEDLKNLKAIFSKEAKEPQYSRM